MTTRSPERARAILDALGAGLEARDWRQDPNTVPDHAVEQREWLHPSGTLRLTAIIDHNCAWESVLENPSPGAPTPWSARLNRLPAAVILAASDAYAYPSASEKEWAHLMIQQLAGYLPAVKPGGRWGDAESNIDYSKSFPQNNRSHGGNDGHEFRSIGSSHK